MLIPYKALYIISGRDLSPVSNLLPAFTFHFLTVITRLAYDGSTLQGLPSTLHDQRRLIRADEHRIRSAVTDEGLETDRPSFVSSLYALMKDIIYYTYTHSESTSWPSSLVTITGLT